MSCAACALQTSSCALLSTFAVECPLRLSPEQLQAASDAKLLFTVAGAPQHDLQPHPETAKRIPAILKALRDAGVTPEQRGPQVNQQCLSAVLSWLSRHAGDV